MARESQRKLRKKWKVEREEAMKIEVRERELERKEHEDVKGNKYMVY